MGLYVHSLANIPKHTSRSHYVYLLDYGWDEPIGKTLRKNFGKIAQAAEDAGAAAIMGLDGIHFSNEVFSFHHINGISGEEVLPAILISTLNPSYFQGEKGSAPVEEYNRDDVLLLIPLNQVCDKPSDVILVITKVFKDIKEGTKLKDFEVARMIAKDKSGSLFDAVILEPNFAGLGVDIKAVYAALRGHNKTV